MHKLIHIRMEAALNSTTHIGESVRQLRQERRWAQAELAQRLGISQARISRIEQGTGSLRAEEFLQLMELFQVGVDRFLPATDPQGSLQNALIRFGAQHLRQVPSAHVLEEYASPKRAILRVLLDPRSERLVTALAPVLIGNIDGIALPTIQDAAERAGAPNRFVWLCRNVLTALDAAPADSADERRSFARARTVLSDFLSRLPAAQSAHTQWDPFDQGVRSPQAQLAVRTQASDISKKTAIESLITPDDFATAIREARESLR
jgi:transcriptional regulator with XRE-family HTH domain